MDKMRMKFFRKPAKLTDDGKKAYYAVMSVLKADNEVVPVDSGGCTTFYGPKQWANRGWGEYGQGSVLIVCHDGGDVAPYFNYDYEAYEAIERMNKTLKNVGLYAEPCTGWCTAIYKL